MFDWRILDAADDEQPLHLQPAASSGRRRRWRFIAAILLVICLLAGTGAFWRMREIDREVRASLGQVMTVEDHAWERGDPDLLKAVLDRRDTTWMTSAYLCFFSPSVYSLNWRDPLTMTLEDYRWLGAARPDLLGLGNSLRGEGTGPMVMAHVLVRGTALGNSFSYREVQFYRLNSKGDWLRTAPDATLWGAWQESGTRFVRVSHSAMDATAVQAALGGIDDLVLRASTDLGIVPPEVPLHLQIAHRLDGPSFRLDLSRAVSDTILSPLLYPETIDLPAGTILRWDITNRVVDWLVHSATDKVPATGLDEQVRIGLFDWIRRDWLQAPLWDDAGEVSLLRSWSQAHPLLVDGTLAAHRYVGDSRRCLGQLGQDVYAMYIDVDSKPRSLLDPTRYAIIDYITRTYGRQSLPVLTRSLCCASTWDQLLHVALKVDRPTFEAGLRQHLRLIQSQSP